MMKKDIQLLEKVQNRSTKMIPSLRHMSYEDRLKAMELSSLIYRILQGDATETFKYLYGFYHVNSSVLLPLNQPSGGVTTRGHCLKLQKRGCRTSLRANILGYRIVNFWDALPEHVVTAVSLL